MNILGRLSPKAISISEGEKDIIYELIHKIDSFIKPGYLSLVGNERLNFLVDKTVRGYVQNPNNTTNITICKILNSMKLPKKAIIVDESIKLVNDIESELNKLNEQGHAMLKKMKRIEYLQREAVGVQKINLEKEQNQLAQDYLRLRKRIRELTKQK